MNTQNTGLFEGESYDTLLAYSHGEKFLTNEAALSMFLLGEMVVYKSTVSGEYFYNNLNGGHREFFFWDDPAIVNELTPLPPEYLKFLETLEERNKKVTPFGLNLVEIKCTDDNVVTLYLYEEELQVFFAIDPDSFENIDENTYPQLIKLNPYVNTLAEAYTMTVDDDGNVKAGA